MRRTETSRFTLRADGEATVIDIHAARPDFTFLAAVVLLGGLFGLPTLGVLLNPARYDALSLGAALCAVLVLGLAGFALRRAFRGRAARSLRLEPSGLTAAGEHLPWSALGAREVEGATAGRHATAGGIHGLAAAIAARQRAAETRLVQHRRDGQAPLLLAEQLDAGTAERLRVALDAAVVRYGAGEERQSQGVSPRPSC